MGGLKGRGRIGILRSKLRVIEVGGRRAGQRRRLRKAVIDGARHRLAVDAVGEGAAQSDIREPAAVEVEADIVQDGRRRFPRLIIAAVADGCRGIRVAVHKVRAAEFEIVADVVRRFGRLQLDGLGRHGRGLCLPPAAAAPEHLAVEIIRSRAERRAALYRRRRDDGHIEHQGKILIRRVERDRQGAVVIRRDGQHMRQPAGIERALLRRAQRGGGILRRQGRSVGKAYAGNKGIAIGLSVLPRP